MTGPVTGLHTGAALRVTGPSDGDVVVCVNGGSAAAVPGDWSPTMEYLVGRLSPSMPGLGFAEVRYRVKSWNQLGSCVADGRAAVDAVTRAGARRICLLGFSMGGAVAVSVARQGPVARLVGLAPWLPPELDLAPLAGVPVRVLHGAVDGFLPGVPGVSPAHSRAAVERMRRLGVDATHEVIAGAFHGVAVRPAGRLVPLPRAGEWVRRVTRELTAFHEPGAGAAEG